MLLQAHESYSSCLDLGKPSPARQPPFLYLQLISLTENDIMKSPTLAVLLSLSRRSIARTSVVLVQELAKRSSWPGIHGGSPFRSAPHFKCCCWVPAETVSDVKGY